ncbi:sugar ABC transporter ATP-binding protein [Globicatella sulfidifaciens]|uniref:Sugar ABC transporter ATP-binding protein n=1 Tax=Globicatella sulfidifaciens TaxID=136093 RepID=A0A7X8H125_9LACT|nr:sugar ABC transporter ATP-binding protein [Globicatella sulfidifaciens]NLJ19197.1 sugar ABC transporter ATP-binding protein [Globicatella sulfidifaciens]
MAELLEMKNINKAFSGVHALTDAQFHLRRGEVHAFMGENGAGKSTLMKILTGVYKRDSGEVLIDGEPVVYQNTAEALDDGVVIVHQELNMMDDLKVYENIFIGRESMNGFFINDRNNIRQTKELFEKIGVHIDPNAKVGDLTVGQQQMVEIAKAVSHDAKIVVFDEPTSALTEAEIAELFKIIDDLKNQGIGIIYITHRMDEVFQISDRITVLRDGEYIGTANTSETNKDSLINMMVGRELTEEVKAESQVDPDAEVVLEVENLAAGRMVKDVSFSLRKGEILGVSGLMGAGRTEMARLIYGAEKPDSGTIKLHGEEVQINSTEEAVSRGIGYLSEDRRRYGVLTEQSIAENTVLPSIPDYISAGFIDDRKAHQDAVKFNEIVSTKMVSVDQKVRTLSGGNQQKVVVAKWLLKDSEILIFDEPTRGIDVGAKAEIYNLMQELADEGKSILMISSEMQEILRMSDRVVVMCEGRVTGIVPIEEATQEKILGYAMMREEV